MSKFDESYKMIMEGRYSTYGRQPGWTYGGDSAYSMEKTHAYPVKFGDGSIPYGKNSDGSYTINPITGEQVPWKMLASDYKKITNYLTGERIDAVPTFCLDWHDGRRTKIQIPIADYEAAYANKDEATIAKLEALGLFNGLVY